MINSAKAKLTLAIFCFFTIIQISFSELLLTDWRAETAYNEPKGAGVSSSGILWVATSGGVFSYDPSDSSYQKFNNINGLSSINSSAILTSKDSDLIVCGSESGYIDIFTDGRWINIGDIANSGEIVAKKINSFFLEGNKILVAGEFGLSELFIDLDGNFVNQVFGDSYRNVNANQVKIIDGKLWLCTNSGLAFHDGVGTIADKNNWTYPTELQGKNILDIDIWQGEVYVLTDFEVYKLNATDQFEMIHDNTSDFQYNGFFTRGNILFASFNFGYHLIEKQLEWQRVLDWSQVSRGLIDFNGKLLRLTPLNGIDEFDSEDSISILPDGPVSNNTFDIGISSEGVIWTSSASNGFSRFDGTSWINFNEIEANGYIITNDFKSIDVIGDKIYIGHKGRGQLIVSDKGGGEFEFKILNQFNSELVIAVGKHVEVGGTAKANDGVVWTVNWGDRYDGGPVLMSSFEESFSSFFICDRSVERFYYEIAIDNHGTKWLGSNKRIGSQGLMLFNEMGTLDDESDDLCQVFTSSDIQELTSQKVNSIKIDQSGWVWVGTSKGVVYFINPEAFIYDNLNPASSMIPVQMRGVDGTLDGVGIDVSDIMIDPQNRKWFSSGDGVWVYDEDGAELLARITKENSPLPSNDVKSIEIDKNTGIVYFGTEEGLYIARSLSVEPVEDYNISAYPQPFNLGKHKQVIFDGMSYQSDIKITTPSGRLVRSLSSNSRKISWNGRNESGEKVESGVYLIIATSAEGGKKSVGKFAVVFDD